MHRGYIKIWRKIQDSGLFLMPNTFVVFMHILLNAAHKQIKVGTTSGVITLERGQYISGRLRLSEELRQTERQIRTSIDRLVKMEIMTIKTTNKYSIYTIVNYDNYQDIENKTTSTSANKRPTNDQQTTTKQELEELKELEVKEKINKKEIVNGASNILADYGILGQLAKDFSAHRKTKKAAITETALQGFLREAKKADITIQEAIRISIENGWIGFKADWHKTNITKHKTAEEKRHERDIEINRAIWSDDF